VLGDRQKPPAHPTPLRAGQWRPSISWWWGPRAAGAGLVDALDGAGIKAFGPTAAAARLEGSKGFTKDLCAANGIPTGNYGRFSKAADARVFVRRRGAPIVVKADGLAAGKGVTVAESVAEAIAAIDDMLLRRVRRGRRGGGGRGVPRRRGGELLRPGRRPTALPLATAQDHKRVGDGDTGPNTGGMGAYSPAPVMTELVPSASHGRDRRPTVRAMAEAGTPFKGVLYAGLMITDGRPKLIEYNVRFGDPECQVLMMRLKSTCCRR
jgi:phosphoribosylamine---glycine ligase